MIDRMIMVSLVLALGACSANTRVASVSCDTIGLSPGSDAYSQCLENADIQGLVTQRSLLHPSHNMPAGMLVQQYTHGMTPLINCTDYTRTDGSTICG